MTLFNMDEVKSFDAKTRCKSVVLKTKAQKRLTTAGKRFDRVESVIGSLNMGESLHYVSAGEWSMHDVLFHLLNQTGPADVWVSSWSITEDPCRQLIRAMDAGKITNLNLLFDWRVKIRCPESAALAKHNASSCYLTSSHAKVTVVMNKGWQIAVVGSANYTNNPRIEAGIITCQRDVAEFHRDWITATIEKSDPFEMEGNHVRRR